MESEGEVNGTPKSSEVLLLNRTREGLRSKSMSSEFYKKVGKSTAVEQSCC